MNDRNRWRDSGFALHDHFHRIVQRLKSGLLKKETLEKSKVYRFFGATLLKPELWSFREESIARGLALGLFIALTPTFGLQMVIVCLLIILIPGNLPIALGACWITNPATMLPIHYGQYLVGVGTLNILGVSTGEIVKKWESLEGITDVFGTVWVGALISSTFFAVAGYYGVHGIMALERKVRFEKYIHLRRKRPQKNGEDETKEDE